MNEIPRIPFRGTPHGHSPEWVDSETVKTGAVFGLGLIVGALGAAIVLSRKEPETHRITAGESRTKVVGRASVAKRDDTSLGAIVEDELRGGLRTATTALTAVLRERVAWLLGADPPTNDPPR